MNYKPGINDIGEIFKSSSEQITINVTRAYNILNQLIAVGNFIDSNLNMSKVVQCSNQILSNGFVNTLQQSINKLKFRGLNNNQLTKITQHYKHGERLMDIMNHGQRAIMIPAFTPNGCNGYRQSKSYHDYRAVCNYHMFELLEQGKAIIVPKDILHTDILKQTHVSKLELVQSNKKEGRCCLNAGSKCRKYLSLNDGTDRELCSKIYPKEQLPSIFDICEMAELKRKQIELLGELVVGATIDIADAYRQYTLSPEAAMQRAVIIYLGEEQIPHLVYPLVGWYGDAIAGDVYNIAGGFISWYHNNYFEHSEKCNKPVTAAEKRLSSAQSEGPDSESSSSSALDGADTTVGRALSEDDGGKMARETAPPREIKNRSVTYIDDGIIIDSDKHIEPSRNHYREGAKILFGIESVSPLKDKYWKQDIEAIGWHLNTRYDVWRVAPKQKGLDKIYASLFIRLPMNFCDEDTPIFIMRIILHEIASLLSWYAVVLRMGNSFVRSIFKNVGYGDEHQKVEITLNCKRDIAWWRLISHASMSDPHIMSASISHLRRNLEASEQLYTDASSTIGGGGWIADNVNGDGTTRMEGFIRWSRDEISAFSTGIDGKQIDINVLEFFVVIYFILLWGNELKGKIVEIQCDNTAAISWLLKMRASSKSPVAETLIKVFALYCAAMDITLLPVHIRGIHNVHADFLSRDISLQETSQECINSKDKEWWKQLSRQDTCRQLLMASIVRPHTIPSPLILELLKALL